MTIGKKILMPLPDHDFDPTEVAVPWKMLTLAGYQVVFATERGKVPQADPRVMNGVIFGQLGAEVEPRQFYREMEKAQAFTAPVRWADLSMKDFDGLILAGGHAPGMRQYLAHIGLQKKVFEFWSLKKPVGAICHGVLVLARTLNETTGKSILHDRKTTCLPKYMERMAYYLTAWKLGKYYRTYPLYVADEVKTVLDSAQKQYLRGPISLTKKGNLKDDSAAFVVHDGNYISARWPGDAYLFAKKFIEILDG